MSVKKFRGSGGSDRRPKKEKPKRNAKRGCFLRSLLSEIWDMRDREKMDGIMQLTSRRKD